MRDLRARWALEEARLPYQTRLLELGDQDKPDYRALQPFGQVPILEEDGLVLFESGAIVLHIGERSEVLLPKDAGARARATQWLIAALNSIEPFVMNVALIDLFYKNEEWAKLRRPGAVEFVQKRLPEFFAALRYRIVEPSPILQEQQRQMLEAFRDKVDWHSSPQAFTGVHFSNELLDAMPARLIWLANRSASRSPIMSSRLATMNSNVKGRPLWRATSSVPRSS